MQIELRKTMSPRNENVDVGYFKILQDGYLILKDLDADVVYSAYIKGSGVVSLGEQSYTINSNWQRVILYDTSKDEPMIKFSAGEYYIYENQEEEGNKATDWTPSNEDVYDAINSNSEHISRVEQTADKVEWLIKDGTSEANMVLTSSLYKLIAENIDLTGKVTFNSFNKQLQDDINGKADASDIFADGTTEIDGGKIKTNSIEADSINTEDLFAKNINFTGEVSSKSKNISFDKVFAYPDREEYVSGEGYQIVYELDGLDLAGRYGVNDVRMGADGLTSQMQEKLLYSTGNVVDGEFRKLWYSANGILLLKDSQLKKLINIQKINSTTFPYWIGCGTDVFFDADYISAKKRLWSEEIVLNGINIQNIIAIREKSGMDIINDSFPTDTKQYYSTTKINVYRRDACVTITGDLQAIGIVAGGAEMTLSALPNQYYPYKKVYTEASLGSYRLLFSVNESGYLKVKNLSTSNIIPSNNIAYFTLTYAVNNDISKWHSS